MREIQKPTVEVSRTLLAQEMATYKKFSVLDLFKYANVNLDPFTETYSIGYYMHYMVTWSEYMRVVESPVFTAFSAAAENGKEIVQNLGGRMMGYMIAKSEGQKENWHGHVTALSVAPEYRRIGLAGRLMRGFEDTSERKSCYFLDLFVRASNTLGNQVYTKMGYIIYRRVLNYYSGKIEDEDAFDMRKALSRDTERLSVVPQTRPVKPDELEFN